MRKLEESQEFDKEPNDYFRIDNMYISWTEDSVTLKSQFELTEIWNDSQKERFSQRKTPSFLNIQQTSFHIFDCYHNSEQYGLLMERFKNISPNTLDQLITTIREIQHKDSKQNIVKLCAEFRDEGFFDCLNAEICRNSVESKEKKFLSKSHLNSANKLSKFLRLKNKIDFMLNKLVVSQQSVMKKLKISKRFLNYSINLIRYPHKIEEIKQYNESKARQIVSENNSFLQFFQANRYKYKTKKDLFYKFIELEQGSGIKSLTDFDRKFVKRNNISYQKCKLIHKDRNLYHKEECRVLFIHHLLNLIKLQTNLFFFDETTFEVKTNSFYLYGFKGERPQMSVKIQPIYLRLLLIVSLYKIEAAVISYESVTGNFVFQFLRHFVYIKQSDR